ncbi:MAG: hypothetical protein EOM72_10880, partial [Opitutae bacterium]|nr:hypothetical protein [Opitutae bacterium]
MKNSIMRKNEDLKKTKFLGHSFLKAPAPAGTRRPRGWQTAVAAAAVAAFCALPMQAEAAYSGSGTFNLITNVSDITSGGYYVFVGNQTNAMASANTVTAASTGALLHNGLTKASTATVINDPAVGIVWRIDAVSSSFSINTEAGNRYIGHSGTVNAVAKGTTNSAGQFQWTFATTISSRYLIRNAGSTLRVLKYNTGTPRFACYSSATGVDIQLYKMASATPAIALTNNGTQVAAAYVAAGKTNHILH